MEKLNNKTAIVTEADTAVGLAVAETLLCRGCRVLLAGRATQRLDAIARKYGAEKVALLPMEAGDLALNSIRVVNAALEKFGSLDKVICCTRPMVRYSTETVKVDGIRRAWNDQVVGPLQLIKDSIQPLSKTKGSVVLLSSFECCKPDGLLQSLSAANRVDLVRLAAGELNLMNVRLNAVSPYGSQMEVIQCQTWSEWIYASLFRTPLGREANPKEVAELMVFTTSDGLPSVSGNNFYVDGGISITSPPSYSAGLTLTARVSNVIIDFQNSVLRLLGRK